MFIKISLILDVFYLVSCCRKVICKHIFYSFYYFKYKNTKKFISNKIAYHLYILMY